MEMVKNNSKKVETQENVRRKSESRRSWGIKPSWCKVIREVLYPVWLANTVPVKKKKGKWECV
jgi:hypothetical protein